MALTDNSIMPFGKFKGQAMANVPAWHLIWLHEGNHPRDLYMRENFTPVFAYIQDNIDLIHKENSK